MTYDFNENMALGQFKLAVERYIPNEPEEYLQFLAAEIVKALEYIDFNMGEYVANCRITMEKYHDDIVGDMRRFHSLADDDKRRCMKRMRFRLHDIITEKILTLREWSHENEIKFVDLDSILYQGITQEDKQSLTIRSKLLNFDILKKEINNNKQRFIDAIQEKESEIKNASEIVKSWQGNIDAYEERIKVYAENAKRIASEYNFVGISGAFQEIERRKISSLRYNRFWLIAFGLLMFLPFLATAYNLHSIPNVNSLSIDEKLKMIAYFAIPSVPFEVILIYFFRIILKSYNSLKAQIVQLEIRRSLCAFIEGYAEFAKREKDAKLEKFEAMIFSGLTPDPENVPSTFDGVEQIANFVKAIKDK